MTNFSYNNSGVSTVSYPYPGGSGIFLCSIGPVPITNASAQRYGVALQYNQTKTDHINTDDVLVLYFGRGKPAVETSGIVNFNIFDLAYGWPPGSVGIGDGSGATIEHQLRGIIADCMNGYLVQMQTPQQHGAAYNGIGYAALYGRLQDVQFSYPVDQGPGWTTFQATFTEVG